MPSISRRIDFQWANEPPFEKTSTIALTSAHGHVVDVRVFKDAMSRDGTVFTEDLKALEWAFAAHVDVTVDEDATEFTKNYKIASAKWTHTIDSTGPPESIKDEGTLKIFNNGLEKEEGSMKRDGEDTPYVERWRTDSTGEPTGKNWVDTVVLEASEENNGSGIKGLIVYVEDICQGILMRDGQLTVQRWEKRAGHSTSAAEMVVRIGKPVELPCEITFFPEFLTMGPIHRVDGIVWKIVEVAVASGWNTCSADPDEVSWT